MHADASAQTKQTSGQQPQAGATTGRAALPVPNSADLPPTAAETNGTLLPTLTLDQLHDSLWEQLPKEDRHTLRLLSSAMRLQANDCVRWLNLEMAGSGAGRWPRWPASLRHFRTSPISPSDGVSLPDSPLAGPFHCCSS